MIDLLYACKMAYRKHHLNDDSIGWNELSDILQEALCNAMGDSEFILWLGKLDLDIPDKNIIGLYK